jgi:hypothetical protein
MRTRFADDLLWLPYLTATYVHATGDEDVLDAMEGFVLARPLAAGEDEAYLAPSARPRRPASTSTRRARSSGRCAWALTGCRCSAAATGTTA